MKWINLLNQVGAHPPGKKLRVDSASAAVLVTRGDAEYIDDPATPDVDESLGFVFTINGKSGIVLLSKADLGLSQVNNTSDMDKPISTLVAAELEGKLSIADAPDVVATAVTSPEVKTVLDGTYVRLEDYEPGGGGGGLSVVDNGDGTATLTTTSGSSVSLADNGDGTATITY